MDAYLDDIQPPSVPRRLQTRLGEMFLFVDECHRTQSGKLHIGR